MEKFDIERFSKNQQGGHYIFTLSDGTEVSQSEFPSEFYLETARKPGSPYESYKEFYFDNLGLKRSGTEFYGFPIGIWRDYDSAGKLIEETDEDKPFKFTLEQLDAKLQESKIYIMKPVQGLSVSRNASPEPVYIVTFPVAGDLSEFVVLTIDGNTGKTNNQITKQRKENH